MNNNCHYKIHFSSVICILTSFDLFAEKMSKSNLISSFIPLNSNKQHDEECYLNDIELFISSDELVHHFKKPGFDPKAEASRKGIVKLHQEIETFFR